MPKRGYELVLIALVVVLERFETLHGSLGSLSEETAVSLKPVYVIHAVGLILP